MKMRSTKILIYSVLILIIGLYCTAKKTERKPRYSEIFYKKARACEGRCRLSKLKRYYQKAVYHDPNFVEGYFRLAQITEEEGEHRRSIQLYKKVTELGPKEADHAEAYFKVGVDRFLNHEYELARRYLERADKIYLSYDEARFYLGLTYMVRKEREKAIWQFKRSLNSNNPFYYDIRFAMGLTYTLMGKDWKTEEYLKILQDLGRDDLAEELEQFADKGKCPGNLRRFNLTNCQAWL